MTHHATPRPNVRRPPLDDFSREAAGIKDDPPQRIDDWFYALVLIGAGVLGLALYGLYIAVVTW